jgi:hypothetical protein
LTSFSQHADTNLIKLHLEKITKTENARNFRNIEILNSVASYIYTEFNKYADTTYYQNFDVEGTEYKNVVCVFGSNNTETIVIGAHYDVCQNQEGADDNASGTVGLLELARLLKGKELKHRLEIVAYTLEEPPFFRTIYMGSFIHSKSLKARNENVAGMICLEMIGYYNDRKHTQSYPIGVLSLIYGTKGDYITLVNKFSKGRFSRKFTKQFKKGASLRTRVFNGPKALPGIDFSDHLNYWNFGYNAIMITDTAFYRNYNYHQEGDKLETLNIEKIGQVIDSVLNGLNAL